MPESGPRFPLNSAGDFFVEDGLCFACQAPEFEAPDLMTHIDDEEHGYHCYFHRQPNTPQEVEQAIRAVYISCCGGVQYAGNDPTILARLKRLRKNGWHEPAADA